MVTLVLAASAFGFFVGFGVVVVVVVVMIGHPSLFSPSASVLPSEAQQPNKLLAHNGSGQPLNFLPLAGDTPSSQQPYFVSLHVSGNGQPSSNGPVDVVLLSGQQPNSLLRQADGLLCRILHCLGFCSLVMIASNAFGVVDQMSSSAVLSDSAPVVLDQISVVVSILSVLSDADDDASVDASVDCCSVLENKSVAPVTPVAPVAPVSPCSVTEVSLALDSVDD